ncbi:diaminopimelate decarboxylase [Saccharicrinis sp. FJH2]|uniref:diaminopimelate decarboxylase n=1 Tax=Saccharicrinis sp. FJH65 TaxID=3344659 RepID=UPI0035F4CF19
MNYIYSEITGRTNFFGNTTPAELVEKYGTPLYVYNENILRKRCRELKNLVNYKNFIVNYSAKANSNLELLKIVHDEGLYVDAMSPGEIFVNLKAGFSPEQIFYISNNVDDAEFQYAIDAGVKISVDSVSQLEKYGKLNPGGEVTFRLNPGVGAGHHKKVVTGGKKTKFGIEMRFLEDIKTIVEKYNLKVIGINQHIGSLFMEGDAYAESAAAILEFAKEFKDLEFIDLGGGFGIPYHKQEGQARLDLQSLGARITEIINRFVQEYGKEIQFKIEPGRYISAECGVLLGKVHTTKENYDLKYIGTDLGFNVLVRPMMYDSHHDVEIYRTSDKVSTKKESVRIVGNICETGDIIAKDRELPEIFEDDIIGVLDAGAYGMVMASNYNNRLRPAEVLIDKDGNERLTRKRDTLEDLVRNFV